MSCFLLSSSAFAFVKNGYLLTEICVDTTNSCMVLRTTPSIGVVQLGMETTDYPYEFFARARANGLLGPNEGVGRFSPENMRSLRAEGMPTLHLSESELENWRNTEHDLDREFRNAGVECTGGLIGCGASGTLAVATGGWGVYIAALTCLPLWATCDNMVLAGQKYKKHYDTAKKIWHDASPEASSSGSGSGGGGGGSSGPQGGTTTIWVGAPHPGGTATITDPPNGHAFGGGVPIQPGGVI